MYGFKFFTRMFLAFINVIKIVHWKMFCILTKISPDEKSSFLTFVVDDPNICDVPFWSPIFAVVFCVEPISGQTKDYKFGISCFSAKHAILKTKPGWLGIGLMCREWSNMFVHDTAERLFIWRWPKNARSPLYSFRVAVARTCLSIVVSNSHLISETAWLLCQLGCVV